MISWPTRSWRSLRLKFVLDEGDLQLQDGCAALREIYVAKTAWRGRNAMRTSTDFGLAKKHKRHPLVLPMVVGTRDVIPKQTVAS